MLSLTARLLIAASIVLAAFAAITGLVLDRAFSNSVMVAEQERLQAQVYILLGAADLDDQQRLNLPRALPEARFSIPGSGLYALVVDEQVAPIWRSTSLLGTELARLPPAITPGVANFTELRTAGGQPLLGLGFTVSWEIAPEQYRRYTFWVAETLDAYNAQIGQFRRSLWGWLLAAVIALLTVQALVLRWGLTPLRRIAQQVRDVETGRRGELVGPYPAELKPLADNLNVLIRHGRASLERYRNAVGDLAHSLKTPLAVLNSALNHPPSMAELLTTVRTQVSRMNDTVEYQLQRAAAGGRMALTAPVSVRPIANKVIDALEKVYHEKALRFEIDIGAVHFYGDQGDLMEILGNLTDNACKWATNRIQISASAEASGLVIRIEDDGPGIPETALATILDRGRRADPSVPGHGIGLAVVRDIVEEVYRGTLTIDASPLGGVRVTLRFANSLDDVLRQVDSAA